MRTIEVSTQSITADPNGIAEDQQLVAAGDLTLDGTGVMADDGSASFYIGKVRLDPPRRVTLESAGNLSAVNFTVHGYDRARTPISEVIAGPNANTVTTLRVFESVTRVAADAAVGTDVEVGWGTEHISPWIALGGFRCNYAAGYHLDTTGAGQWDVEQTFRNILRDRISGDYDSSVGKLASSQTADATSALSPIPGFLRLVQISGTGAAVLRVVPTVIG